MTDFDHALTVPEKAKDRRYHYSWVLDEPKSLTLAKMKNYVPVLATDPDGQFFKDDPRKAVDGKVRVGDLLLMRCPIADYERRKAEERKKNSRRVAEIKEEFHGQVGSLGIRSFEESTK